MIWGFGLSSPNTASNFARSTDSTPSLIFLVLRKKHHRKMSWCSGWVSCKTAFLAPCGMHIQRRLRSLVLRKNITEKWFDVRGWVSRILRQISFGVRLYVCAYFPCFAKKHHRKMNWGFVLSFPNTASNFARSTDSTPSLIFLVLQKNITEKWFEVSGWVSCKTAFLAPCGMHIRRWGFCCEKMRGKPEYNLQIKACFVGCGEPLGAICNLRNSQKG